MTIRHPLFVLVTLKFVPFFIYLDIANTGLTNT